MITFFSYFGRCLAKQLALLWGTITHHLNKQSLIKSMMTLCESMLPKGIITGERRFFTLFFEEIGFFLRFTEPKKTHSGVDNMANATSFEGD